MARRSRPNLVGVQLAVLTRAAVLLAAGAANATVRHVPGEYPTIQAAIDASTFGDEVLVGPGTYAEEILIGSARDGIHLASTGGPDVTTITSVPDQGGPSPHHVVTCADNGASTIIEGFTITGGSALVQGAVGGGVWLSHSDGIVRNNVITRNIANAGGGIYVDGGSPTIEGNTISHNGGLYAGGGISIDGGQASIVRNVIVDNTANGGPLGDTGGGGIAVGNSPALQISECTIVGNSAPLGAGLFVGYDASPTLNRTVVAFNTPWPNTGTGAGIEVGAPTGSLSMGCSDVFGNSGGNFAGMTDPTGTNGNQSADPVFCDLQARDLTISVLSPCAPAHSPSGCGLVGALGPICDATPTKRSSWGQLKARFR